jgi:hypothetical protein
LNREQIKALREKALVKEFNGKAEIAETLMEKEEHVPKTGNARSHLAGRRTVRKARAATQ